MASPTLAVRVGILAAVVFGAIAVIALALAAMFFVGVRAISPTSLAIGLLVVVAVFAGVALALVFAASLLALAAIAIVVFIVIALVVAPPVAIVAVLMVLVLVALLRAAIGNPSNIPFWLLLLFLLLIPVAALATGLLGPGGALVSIAVLGYVAIAIVVTWLLLTLRPLPLPLLGLDGLSSMPAVPLATLPDFIDAAIRLKGKQAQEQAAINGLTNVFTLGAGTPRARTATARTFLFEGAEAKEYTLDAPAQFDMAWTTLRQLDTRAAPLSPGFSAALSPATPAAATTAFWTNLSRYWGGFGVLPIEAITTGNLPKYTALLSPAVSAATLSALTTAGPLFGLDMTVFAKMDPPTASNTRWSPVCVALFRLDTTTTPGTPFFSPILIQVSDGANTQVYAPPPLTPLTTPGAWVYALQALKAATTAWGIWLGHVYRYHMIAAPMQMTMFRELRALHPVRQVLGFQSKFVIGFDTVLLIDWSFPPPTSAATSIQFLQLVNAFAALPGGSGPTRNFFDDDPETALLAQGLPKATFTNPIFSFPDINLPGFVARLRAELAAPGSDPVSAAFIATLSGGVVGLIGAYAGGEDPALQASLVTALNAFIGGPSLAGLVTGAGVTPSADTAAALALATPPQPLLNRFLLQDAYPIELWICQWNLYPAAHYVVSIFRAATTYATAVVAALYPLPGAAAADVRLQRWLLASSTYGKVRGLPVPLATNAQLTAVLASLLYRITAHGIARLEPIGNPGLSWIGNFPPCLENARIPDPLAPSGNPAAPDLTAGQILEFLPRTGTIGEMISFIYGFGFTDPFESLIPPATINTTAGPDEDLHPFVALPPACDAALQTFRAAIAGFIRFFLADQNALNAPAVMNFSATDAVIHQWERNIEQ